MIVADPLGCTARRVWALVPHYMNKTVWSIDQSDQMGSLNLIDLKTTEQSDLSEIYLDESR